MSYSWFMQEETHIRHFLVAALVVGVGALALGRNPVEAVVLLMWACGAIAATGFVLVTLYGVGYALFALGRFIVRPWRDSLPR